ncbi:MAG: ABC transporter ATP-binding protein [Betaproteobacteria bacterium]|nr:ABC transporter ATP-binding protein [Betaproteobacteria bacterium]
MAELEVENVSLGFGGLRVLREVSFSAVAGEMLALIGPNGAGKTSLFNCISGIYSASGRIRFRGQDLIGRKPHEIAALGVGRTFQHAELFPQMSVLENVLTGRHARFKSGAWSEMLSLPAMRREEDAHRAHVERIIAFVELQWVQGAMVESLSFGTQKIVGFARALAAEPTMLLLDEPSAGLTREEREDLAHFILKTKEALGICIVWIEHDMQMVADLADRILVLDVGRTIACGPPEAVLRDKAVIQAYLGAVDGASVT